MPGKAARREEIEEINMKREKGEKVRGKGNEEGCAQTAGEAKEINEGREMGDEGEEDIWFILRQGLSFVARGEEQKEGLTCLP